ncbi:MAG: peptidylprolyl isomerase [Vampirovibrionales bacterium]
MGTKNSNASRVKKPKSTKFWLTDNTSQFSALAKTVSQDTLSAVKNGELGVMYAETTVPEFWKAATQTPPNTIHPNVVATPCSFHIIKVNKIIPPASTPK